MLRGDILMFVPEVCTDGIEAAPRFSHLAALTFSLAALTCPGPVSPSTASLTLSSFSCITSSTCPRQTHRDLPQFSVLPQLFSSTSTEQAEEGGKGCARASSCSWRKISPGNAREQCPLAIASSPAL